MTPLQEARLKRGLSQQDLAKKAECSQAYLSDLETQKYIPSAALAKKLADILGISPMDILYPEDAAKNESVTCANK